MKVIKDALEAVLTVTKKTGQVQLEVQDSITVYNEGVIHVIGATGCLFLVDD